jgi:PAS domain S-box-containing protein
MAVALKERRPIKGADAVLERPDGTHVRFRAYPTPLMDETGAMVGALNTLIDVTEYKRGEEIRQQLVSIVESSQDAIVAKDLDGIITNWNHGAEQLFGYTAEEVIGKPGTILIPHDHLDEEPDILNRIRRGERVDHYETVRQCKDGSRVEISLMVSPIRDADGRIIGASKIARDVTERHRAEEQRQLLLREMNHRVKNAGRSCGRGPRKTCRAGAGPGPDAARSEQRRIEGRDGDKPSQSYLDDHLSLRRQEIRRYPRCHRRTRRAGRGQRRHRHGASPA